ncbi:5-methyltetrahydrofolate--homocysteine S-methyltransferase [Clostridium botulinum]|uniref:5-methyltetrahydrofolate--homocysteine S-methyltransferase n=1 Tax=Clostridium botulinum TaxID=1491 RepID=UPI00035BAA55|nr:5-methyltetrahydrofolate--homocysteine S-methyltransferase [Clostridium botulinum]APH23625.1 B12 binding domain protein [Clostridium botulinum]APQ69255.1 B12 binding domain protein [Clostridium botulinum]AUN11264.1 5-methyltetrahydrofolate--homocysteine S-methyltransferase [Clostridium botulinum]AUN21591.1 5-methyltetrahydrofolate--homocysteine S-methyltransferase [Clostridium botulinum]AUN25380.1 5-methyltetrahydrofolate--homocysteine S-methyltransferase [Clostridium botulinum]
MNIKDYIKENILIFDGAMGTMLQKLGLKISDLPEELNILEPEKIINIHRKYIEAGAKVITTNTFGANEIKLKQSEFSLESIIDKAIGNVKKAGENKEILIALDIGPIGQLLEPMGTLKFEEAYEIFKRQIVQGQKSGADIILIETMTDLYEAKAAILAAKENTNLPVFCTMTFEKNKRTFTGCTPLSMILTLEGLGVDALGVNCSLGPNELGDIVDEIIKYSSIPIMVQPNAGLPTVKEGKTIYNIKPKEFAAFQRSIVKKGVRIVGGCCGTTDEFIREIVYSLKDVEIKNLKENNICGVCSSTKAVLIDGVKIIGERINPTGKKLFKEALRNNDIDYILKEAIAQVESGADILDVNVGLPEIDEEETMKKVIREIQSIIDTPLQIDSNNPKVIEKALRVYNGKAIVNSVNGEEEVLDSVLPLIKKYGAAVVALTLDDKGIPKKAEERLKIAEKIVNKALEYGIRREDIFIDCLVLTASAQQSDVGETLKAVALVKEKLKVKTILGVSNISFGLPNRELINKTFLAMSLQSGLDLPILNPNNKEMINIINAYRVLNNEDKGAANYIERYTNEISNSKEVKIPKNNLTLKEIVIKGIKEEAYSKTKELIKNRDELLIINEELIPALDEVGEKYEKGIIFLPQLIQSAETVKKAFTVIKEKLREDNSPKINKGKILMATVKGDIHDIGKNIVKVILENYGFDIIDLGKDVEAEKIVEEVKKNNIKLVGLSALMTTTVNSMKETIKILKERGMDCKVFVGGAVLNKEYAEMINADYYAKDAKEAVDIAKGFFGGF